MCVHTNILKYLNIFIRLFLYHTYILGNVGTTEKYLIVVGNLPSVGGDADEGDKEKDLEEEKLRQEAIKEAEEKRRVKHKKMEEDRENVRQNIRDKVNLKSLFCMTVPTFIPLKPPHAWGRNKKSMWLSSKKDEIEHGRRLATLNSILLSYVL